MPLFLIVIFLFKPIQTGFYLLNYIDPDNKSFISLDYMCVLLIIKYDIIIFVSDQGMGSSRHARPGRVCPSGGQGGD